MAIKDWLDPDGLLDKQNQKLKRHQALAQAAANALGTAAQNAIHWNYNTQAGTATATPGSITWGPTTAGTTAVPLPYQYTTSTGYTVQPAISKATKLALAEDGVHIMVGTTVYCIVPPELLEQLEGLVRMAVLAKLTGVTEPAAS